MRKRRTCRWLKHDEFAVVDGRWTVVGFTIFRRGHLVWHCQLYESIDGKLARSGIAHVIGTRPHAEKWAREAIERAKQSLQATA